jgi:phage/plasmid primase-like uncharacterized protein
MRARDITKALGGDWLGTYGKVPGPGHSPKDRSVTVKDGADGNIIVHGFAADDWRDIKAAWRAQGLLPEWKGNQTRSAAEIGQRRQQAQERQWKREKEQQAADTRKTKWVRGVFRDAVPIKGGSGQEYLRGRGINIAPLSLRYASGLKHKPTGLIMPALVAAIQGPDGRITAIHRIFLTSDGRQKAPVSDIKMTFGPTVGGAVRLALAKDNLLVGEGVETMLSVQQETARPCWAALTTSGLKALILPDIITSVTICTDRDDNGAGEKAAHLAAQRWRDEGRKVRIALPPNGHKDFNDALMAGGKREFRHE